MKTITLFITLLLIITFSFGEVLTLEDCIRLAAMQNKTVLSARENFNAAKSQQYQAFTGMLPFAQLKGTYTRLNEAPYSIIDPASMGMPGEPIKLEMGKAEMYKGEINLTEPIAPQIWTGYAMAKKNASISKLEFKKAQLNAVAEAKMAYYRYVQAKAFLQIAEVSKKQMDSHIQQLQNMTDAGIIHKKDLLSAQVKGAEAELMVIQANNAINLSIDALKMAIGLATTDDIEIADTLTYREIGLTKKTAVYMTLKNCVDIHILNRSLEIAKLNVTMAWEGLLPSFAAVFNYAYNKPNRKLENRWYDSWTAVGVLSWDIFNWGSNISKISEAKAQNASLEFTINNAKDAIVIATKAAFNNYDEKKRSLGIADKAIETAEESFKVTTDLYDVGSATNTELLDAQADLTRAKINRLNMLADYNIAISQLELFTGDLERQLETILSK